MDNIKEVATFTPRHSNRLLAIFAMMVRYSMQLHCHSWLKMAVSADQRCADCGRGYPQTQIRRFSCGRGWSADPPNKHICRCGPSVDLKPQVLFAGPLTNLERKCQCTSSQQFEN